MLARERPLNRLLALAQPVEGDVELVFVNLLALLGGSREVTLSRNAVVAI